MKKFLHSTALLLLSWCLALAGLQQAQATHIQGGQITYRYISGDTYEITVSFYRDCAPGAASLPPNVDIVASTACNGGTRVTATLLPVPGSLTTGQNLYCPSVQAQATCTPASAIYPNFERQDFRGTINLPPAPDWIIAHESCCRPSTANIPTQDDFRFEATLNNQIRVNGVLQRVNNSSPLFSSRDVPVPFVLVNQQSSINFTAAFEADGDSLVYELDRPLGSCGVFNPYSPRPTMGGCTSRLLTPAAPNTVCFLDCGMGQGGPNYTAELPLPVAVDTIGVCGTIAGTAYTRTVVPRFRFDRTTGEFVFTPNLFRPGNTNLGLNKYVVVGKITEYRRLPGSNRRYRVGSVRRDFLIIIINGVNGVPSPPVGTPVTPGSGTSIVTTVDSLQVTIQPCNYSQVLVRFTDPDPTDQLTVTYTGTGTINTDVLESGDIGTYTLVGNGSRTPVARFLFQPSPAFGGRVLRIPFQIQDNACPTRGLQNRILIVRIAPTRRDLATAVTAVGMTGLNTPGVPPTPNVVTICPGGILDLRGTVGRPDSTRGRLQTYTYAWTGNGIVGNANTPNVRVAPLITTRYRLRVNPDNGFQTGVCEDTTSVLVRVAPEPKATITLADTTTRRVCGGATITLQGRAARRNDQLADIYTYAWTGPGVPANTTTQNVTVTLPTQPGSYTFMLRARGQSQYGCEADTSITIRVVPPPSISTRNYSALGVCTGTAVSLKARISRADNLADTYTIRWDAAPGLNPADVAKDSIVVRPTVTTRYRYRVTGLSRFNCTDTASVLVKVLAQPIVSARSVEQFICAGGTATLKAAAISPVGINDTYTYVWSGPGLMASAGDSVKVRPTVTTRYLVRATGQSAFGCTDTASVVVRIAPQPVVQARSNVPFVCSGSPVTLTASATAPPGIMDAYTYTWSGPGLVSTTGASVVARPTANARYRVMATGRSPFGCADTASVVVRIAGPAIAEFSTLDSLSAAVNGRRTMKPPVFFTFTNTSRANLATSGTNQLAGARWTYQRVRDITGAPIAAETPVQFSTQVTPAPLELKQAGYYVIKLTTAALVNGQACTEVSFQRTVLVPDYDAPNVITPDGDGKNDKFRISSASTLSKLEIYNRWGRKVNEYTNYANDWDATGQPAGIYYYLITDRNGATSKGWLEVVK